MRSTTTALILAFTGLVALPTTSAFLPTLPSTPAIHGRRSIASSSSLISLSSTEESAAEALSRKERSKEQVRSLLKGLGELDDDEEGGPVISKKKEAREGKEATRRALKEKSKLDPEIVFFEGPPDWSEVVVPAISILTVIGIIPFASSVARQIWGRYKITSRRVSVTSGIGGKDLTEVIYPDIEKIKYVFRAFGRTGDMVLFLRDGAKLEIRSIPNFRDTYNYIRERLEDDAKANTPVLPSQS